MQTLGVAALASSSKHTSPPVQSASVSHFWHGLVGTTTDWQPQPAAPNSHLPAVPSGSLQSLGSHFSLAGSAQGSHKMVTSLWQVEVLPLASVAVYVTR